MDPPARLDGGVGSWSFILSRSTIRSPSTNRVSVDTIQCRRCKKEKAPLEKAPFKNPLGDRIHGEICQDCWADWLEHQTMLMNHHGLDPRNPKAREFLYKELEKVLLGGGGAEKVDTSRKGSIEH